MAINVWGSKDILYQTGIAGQRGNLAGLETINIESIGSTHFDYMRRDNADTWNIEVSNFVTRLIQNSKSKDAFNQFLTGNSFVAYEGDKWVVRLPGWESRQ